MRASYDQVEVLLYKQDGQALFSIEPQTQFANLLDDVGLDAVRRLVEKQHARHAQQNARDGQHLLLAPAQGAAKLKPPFLENREKVEGVFQISRRCADRATDSQIVLDGQIAENATSLGDVADTEPGAGLGRQMADILAI